MTEKFRGVIKINRGHFWGLIDATNGINTWAPIGSVARVHLKDLVSRYWLARCFFAAGILDRVTGPIIRENGVEVIETIRGCAGPIDKHRAGEIFGYGEGGH